MSDSIVPVPEVRAATAVYDWLIGCRDEQAVATDLHAWVVSGSADNSLSSGSLRLALERIGRDEQFQSHRTRLLRQWQARMGAGLPDELTATEFLNDWIGSLDHSLIFVQNLLAGITHIAAGKVGDTETTLYGNRPLWTLHMVLEGRASYTSDRVVEAGPGDMLLIGPAANCHYGRHADCETWVHAWVVFQPGPDWLRWMHWPACGEHIAMVSLEDPDLAGAQADLLRQILRLGEQGGRYREDLQLNLLQQVLIRASASVSPEQLAAPDARVVKASDFIRERLAETLSVADVARHCNVSPSRLAHLFKADLGLGLHQFRDNLRMQQARKLLVTSSLPVAAIAAEVGYAEQARFSKQFKARTGCSPREFRRRFARPVQPPAA